MSLTEWNPEGDQRVTDWIRENWTTFIQFGHDKLVQKSIQTVIGIFFKELSKKAGGIIGDLVSPDELNSGEDQAVIAWRMEQELTTYLNSRPSMCSECGACISSYSGSECPAGVFGY